MTYPKTISVSEGEAWASPAAPPPPWAKFLWWTQYTARMRLTAGLLEIPQPSIATTLRNQ